MTTIAPSPKIVLIGLESVGKSALFRALTGIAAPDETNFRGSTVQVQVGQLLDHAAYLIDTPGIQVRDDSATSRLALRQIEQADTVLLVVRGTQAQTEIDLLLTEIRPHLANRKVALVITFADKVSPELAVLAGRCQDQYGIPTAVLDARRLNNGQHEGVLAAIRGAATWPESHPIKLESDFSTPPFPIIEPQRTLFERPRLGPWAAIIVMVLLFALPVYLAYHFSVWLQPIVDQTVITPLTEILTRQTGSFPMIHALLAGDYGLLTLGWYSFLWAFPVVVLIGLSVAFSEETGLKDRITAALDPWLRHIGLNGRDLIPVLGGFGCNVVAIFQTRACHHCTRHACVSLIAFGSACSYQIGASLSIFSAARQPWLFAPYLLTLFLVGAIHTRLWHKSLAATSQTIPLSGKQSLNERAFLQPPTLSGIWRRLKAVVRQFLLEAMPIFLTICVFGALLAFTGLLDSLSQIIAPLLSLFHLPAEAASGIVFAIIRKDGLLVLNQGQGRLLASLTASQIFILVYLASTLTACLVTLWTIRKELGWSYALTVAGRQATTSLFSSLILTLLL